MIGAIECVECMQIPASRTGAISARTTEAETKKDMNMNMKMKDNQITALMLLEMGLDGLNPEFGSMTEYAMAAHSFIQAEGSGGHSWDGAVAFVERITAAARLEESMPEVGVSELTASQIRTLEACSNLGGWNTAQGIAANGGSHVSLGPLTRKGLMVSHLFPKTQFGGKSTRMWRVVRWPVDHPMQNLATDHQVGSESR